MSVALFVKLCIGLQDRFVDPRATAPWHFLGTGFHNLAKGGVDLDGESIRLDRARKTPRHMERVEGQDAAKFWINPIKGI